MAKPCTPHLIAQRVQIFKLQTRNENFLWEGVREGDLFLKKRSPSLLRIPCTVQGTSICPLAKAIVAAILQKAPFGHNSRK